MKTTNYESIIKLAITEQQIKSQWQINSKEGKEGIEKFIKLITPGIQRTLKGETLINKPLKYSELQKIILELTDGIVNLVMKNNDYVLEIQEQKVTV